MIHYPLTIHFEKQSPSPLASIVETLDSPVIFYLVFVLPFLLLAAVFRPSRRYTCVFGDEGITVYYKGIITQKIRGEQVCGIDALAGEGAGVLNIRWKKRINKLILALDIPGTCFRDLGMSLEDTAVALKEKYRTPAGHS